jgi:translation initiation factor IF-3
VKKKKRHLEKTKKIESNPRLLNEKIPFPRVLLVNENEKEIVSIQEALSRARKVDLDLLCVAPQVNPPVCKIINYQKYLFELSKKKKTKKENTNKEMSFSFNIEDNDLKKKLEKDVKRWLENGLIVKLNLTMKGKEKAHPEIVREKCQKIIDYLQSQSNTIELKDSIRQLPGSFSFFLHNKRKKQKNHNN